MIPLLALRVSQNWPEVSVTILVLGHDIARALLVRGMAPSGRNLTLESVYLSAKPFILLELGRMQLSDLYH